MKTFALVIPLALAGALLVATALRASPEPPFAQELPLPAPIVAQHVPAPTATVPVAALPQSVSSLPWKSADLANETATELIPASLPTVAPTAIPEPTRTPPPSPTEAPRLAERADCDPAYPDERTCIPRDLPKGQGCAITDERLFTVLPPDPQRLDHDKDGIGCEPVR